MEVGVSVWRRDAASGGWVPSVILTKECIDNKLRITLVDDDTEKTSSFDLLDGDKELADVKLRNDDHEACVENLINLPYLHEPAILFCLERRYNDEFIYTYTGPILIAMNPFKSVPLYTSKILESYYNAGLLASQGIDSAPLPPHVYAIADAAYRNMMMVVMNGYGLKGSSDIASSSANQAILISGESGAGKTESTKIVLRYLTAVGNNTGSVDFQTGSVMDKILQSNPILEAFGNARTLRNDNSSRFGKYIDLNFSKRGHLIGGSINTYLLEKVRLPNQSKGERNFHIFYQIVKGASDQDRANWKLLPLSEFSYTNQGEIYDLKHVNDVEEYAALRNALNTLNFSESDQKSIFNMVAGILHLGQLRFVGDSEGSSIVTDDKVNYSLNAASELLCIDTHALIRTLTIRTITARGDSYEKSLTPTQASDARDALSKAIYGRLFGWIVRVINTSIKIDKSLVRADIGVLDIFGFECFKNNSFEQLCINYTNETLQQQFNQFVFKMEQAEYKREKIEWSFIEFPDNQDCLDLIEHKKDGILAMLDDECRLPNGTDDKLASRMYKAYEGVSSRFSSSAALKRDSKFCINHYAGPVTYNTITFVEKNKDELPKEAAALMQTSIDTIITALFIDATTGSDSDEKKNRSVLASVGNQFKNQLSLLMNKIYSTAPHYIRCLKPNDENVPDNFNFNRTSEQLRYGGVLEAIRVARSGYPVRMQFKVFVARYRSLHSTFSCDGNRHVPTTGVDRDSCDFLLHSLTSALGTNPLVDESCVGNRSRKHNDYLAWRGRDDVCKDSIQVGVTMVFLRKSAHDILESRRSRRVAIAAKQIQSMFRCFKLRAMFLTIKWAVRLIQRVTRGVIARAVVRLMRDNRAATLVQTAFRAHLQYYKYLRIKSAVVIIQSSLRARKAYILVSALLHKQRSIRLARVFYGLMHRYRYVMFRKALVSIQCRYRCRAAVRQLLELRRQAKDIGKLQQSNENLKAEIDMLRAMAAEESKRMQEQLQVEMDTKARAAKEVEFKSIQEEMLELRRLLAEEKTLRVAAEEKLRISDRDLQAANDTITHLQSKAQSAAPGGGVEVSISPTRRSSITLTEPMIPATPTLRRPSSSDMTPVSIARRPSKPMQDSIDVQELVANLQNERASKMILEEEVIRLRHISMDLTTQVENLKAQTQQDSNTGVKRRTSLLNSTSLFKPTTTATTTGSATTASTAVASAHSSNSNNNILSKLSRLDHPKLSTVTAAASCAPNSSDWGSAWSKKPSISDDIVAASDDTSSSNTQPPMPSFAADSVNSSSTTSGSGSSMSAVSKASNPMAIINRQKKLATMTNPNRAADIDVKAALLKFGNSLDAFRLKFHQGIRVHVWEGDRIARQEMTIKLADNDKFLYFEHVSRARFPFSFTSPKDINPVNIVDIIECIPGGDTKKDSGTDDHCLLTLVAKDHIANETKVITMLLPTRIERNTTQTGIKTMMSETHLRFQKSVTDAVTTESGSGSRDSSSSGSGSGSKHGESRATRRQSLRDATLEAIAHPPPPQPTPMDVSPTVAVSPSNIDPDDIVAAASPDVRKQLLVERKNYERLMMQMLMLTNDLNEREDMIIQYKTRETEMKQTIAAKERMYEQDAMVRMQLGKRLEQVFMDKEEALEQIKLLEEALSQLRNLSHSPSA